MMRTIPNKRLNSDYLFSSYYKIQYNQVDRMCSYKITASFISYFVSYYDNYYIVPQQNEYICNIYADERFDKLYFVKKISANRINSIKLSDSEQMKQIFSLNSYNNNINLRHLESQSFSIRSLYPSYVQMLNKKRYLISILQNIGINISDENVVIYYDESYKIII